MKHITYTCTHTLYTEILASKMFHTFWFTGYLAILMFATWVSLHYNTYKTFLKLATSSSEKAKINADEYFLCIG